MAKPRKKHTGFFPWNDPKNHEKGFKLNFSEVIYLEVGRTVEGYKLAQFVELKNPELALDFDYPQEFYISAEGFILVKNPQGQFNVIAKTDNA
ncbi:hypothetical protein A3K93_04115 [Acinetobacter sp. NCu2D-2]|uniref:hypothetical protein n=1 Tax=Acinetobacter sp. NCu2D-2 TaxID=1608473 RepID=UPI0007CDD540|nr:hypothetical protein [Acinetobacter sp. NCu2D-2]ANF81456.1 hypothetical protein A3K93_04115 [Acinetobacter sp. NCu2D-2]